MPKLPESPIERLTPEAAAQLFPEPYDEPEVDLQPILGLQGQDRPQAAQGANESTQRADVKTDPRSTTLIVSATPLPPDRPTRVCTVCLEEKFKRGDFYSGQHVCLSCKAKQQAAQLAAKTEARRLAKETTKVMRAQAKKQAYDRKYDAEKRAQVSAQDAELARRTLAKRRLIEFTRRFHPDYQAGWVHRDVCRRLEQFLQDVVDKKSPRLMLFLPPRSGKSQLASINFPAWVLGQHPWMEIISSSYAVSLPITFSRKVRELVQDPAYQAMFPHTHLDRSSASAEAWLTTQGGGYVASGVGTGITGKGFNIGIIDDPIKDAEEADSETVREKVWDWYSSTFYTRAAPGAGILVVLTRWHDADLAGKLLQRMKEDKAEGSSNLDEWQVISYPALAISDEWVNVDGSITEEPKTPQAIKVRSKGEALHPERFPVERLERIKQTLQPRHWSALYQQRPTADEGTFFQKSMVRYHNSPPPKETLKVFACWDLAVSQKQTADYTAGVIAGLDYLDQLYILDVIHFRGDADKIAEAIVTSAVRWGVELVGIEKGQLELAIKPTLTRMMRDKRVTFALAEGENALVPITDKMSRARPLQGLMQQGRVFIDSSQPWSEDLVDQLLRFPVGIHDDMVDACAYLARMALKMDPPKPPKRPTHTLESKLSRLISDVGRLNTHMGA